MLTVLPFMLSPVWGREYVDGFQFVYKHESTGALLDGPRCVTSRVDVQGATDMHEFTLYPNEYIVAVRGRQWHEFMLYPSHYIDAVRERQDQWTVSLELKTVCNRVFRAGGNGGQPFEHDTVAGSEERLLVATVGRNITNIQSRASPARYELPEQVTNSFYQLVLRHPAFRVRVINSKCAYCKQWLVLGG